MNTKKLKGVVGLLAICTIMTACEEEKSSDAIQRQGQERLSKAAAMQVGMPAIVNFQEKRILKNILELRDTEVRTITYTQDMSGRLHKLCDSAGYGIPYATQYTNPQRVYEDGHGTVAIPQADPNGLFSPASADGTWVLCYNKGAKKMSPVYVEPHIIVSPFALEQ